MRVCLTLLTNYYGSRDTGTLHTNIASITRGGGPMDRRGGADVSLAWFSVFTPDYARINIEWLDADG
jgi:hypothetical protein